MTKVLTYFQVMWFLLWIKNQIFNMFKENCETFLVSCFRALEQQLIQNLQPVCSGFKPEKKMVRALVQF